MTFFGCPIARPVATQLFSASPQVRVARHELTATTFAHMDGAR
jgi:hypothetical protein